MKKIFIVVFVLSLLCAGVAFAAETGKIGYVNLQRVILECEAGKKARLDLETIEKSKKTVIDEKVKVIKKLEEELTKQASVLSADAKKAKEEELEKTQRDAQRILADSRAELQKKENELTEAILKDIIEVLRDIGQEKGYSIILRSEVALYVDKAVDITDAVISKVNDIKPGSKTDAKEKSKDKPKGKK